MLDEYKKNWQNTFSEYWKNNLNSENSEKNIKGNQEDFLLSDFPSKKDENWRQINNQNLHKTKWHPAKKISIDDSISSKLTEVGNNCVSLVFINGFYSKEYSSNTHLEGLKIEPLKQEESFLSKTQNHLPDSSFSTFASLNNALALDNFHVRISKNLTMPIVINYFSDSFDEDTIVCKQNIINIEKNCSAQVYERLVGSYKKNVSEKSLFHNNHLYISLAEGAQLQHYKVQNENQKTLSYSFSHVKLEKNATYQNLTISLGGKESRNSSHIELNGKRDSC